MLTDLLTKRFDGILAIDDLGFVLARRTVTGFFGPSGAGSLYCGS